MLKGSETYTSCIVLLAVFSSVPVDDKNLYP